MNDPMVWSLRGKPVIITDDAHFSSKFSPTTEHRLLVKRALEQLSNTPKFTVPTKVTVDTLPWPIRAIVESNNGRQQRWATHLRHQHLQSDDVDTAVPFVFMNRDLKLPVTKSLTLEIIGTKEHPIIKDIYPGQILPPLPWELTAQTDLAVFVKSMLFWRSHSFLYDKSCVVDKLRETAPSWCTYLTPPTLLLL